MTDPLQIALITGLSGAGRRTAAHAMEDLGWYVVDNLPPVLIPALVDTLWRDGTSRIAVVVDVRSREQFEQLPKAVADVKALGATVTTVFLEADDDVIVQRQESNRRPLPLQGGDRLMEGIRRERLLLADQRARADIVVDTSRLSARHLVQRISNHFGDEATDRLKISLISFGFKNGVPIDADMVFDVRFLPNPFWVPTLRELNGQDKPVSDYVLSSPGAGDFLDAYERAILVALEGYAHEDKHFVTIAIGCTGGQHRSVVMSEELARRLRAHGISVTVSARELHRARA